MAFVVWLLVCVGLFLVRQGYVPVRVAFDVWLSVAGPCLSLEMKVSMLLFTLQCECFLRLGKREGPEIGMDAHTYSGQCHMTLNCGKASLFWLPGYLHANNASSTP